MTPPGGFLIDGLNLAYWCGRPASLRLPLALMEALLAGGHPAVTFFDASARHQLAGEVAIYAALQDYPHHFVEALPGRTADSMLLRQARSAGACILSRDRFRDHRRRYRKLIDDVTRVLSGGVQDDHLWIPLLDLRVALPPTADEAWARLQQRLLPDQGSAGAGLPTRPTGAAFAKPVCNRAADDQTT